MLTVSVCREDGLDELTEEVLGGAVLVPCVTDRDDWGGFLAVVGFAPEPVLLFLTVVLMDFPSLVYRIKNKLL